MDLGIKELGITLIVGVFTLLGVEVIAHFLFNHPLTTFFHDVLKGGKSSGADVPKLAAAKTEQKNETEAIVPVATSSIEQKDAKEVTVTAATSKPEEKDGKEATVTIAAVAALVFAVGMVIETISYKYVDDQTLIFKTWPAIVLHEELARKLGMPPKDDDKVAALFGSLDNPQRSSLAFDLAHSDAFLISDNNKTGLRVQNWLKNGCALNSCDCATREDIQQSAENLYYYAKNMAYSDDNHYHELGQIQGRLEFARSFSLIGFLGFGFVLCFVAVRTAKWIYRRWVYRKLRKRQQQQTSSEEARIERIHIRRVAVAFFLAYLFGLWAYAGETQAFNRRAFGYLSSQLIQERRAAAQAIKLEVEKAKVQTATESTVAAAAGSATKAGPATK